LANRKRKGKDIKETYDDSTRLKSLYVPPQSLFQVALSSNFIHSCVLVSDSKEMHGSANEFVEELPRDPPIYTNLLKDHKLSLLYNSSFFFSTQSFLPARYTFTANSQRKERKKWSSTMPEGIQIDCLGP